MGGDLRRGFGRRVSQRICILALAPLLLANSLAHGKVTIIEVWLKHPVNSFKKALASGHVQIGLWLALADAYSAEICAGAGFDWLLIDAEHAPNDVRTILAQLQALAAYPVQALVRPPVGDTHLIKQLLDLGAQTLLIPMVETAAQARQLVAAARYPPAGVRGVGSALARASHWNGVSDYLGGADAQVCLILQIESAKGLEALEEIAAVPGVDGLFLGPADLAASLGYLGQPTHSTVQAAIRGALQRAGSVGLPIGILSADEEQARLWISLGASFVAVGSDTTLLARSARALAQRFKTGEATPTAKVSDY